MKNVCVKLVYLQRLYKDARSTKHKSSLHTPLERQRKPVTNLVEMAVVFLVDSRRVLLLKQPAQ